MSVDFLPPNDITIFVASSTTNQTGAVINFDDSHQSSMIDSLVTVRVPIEVFRKRKQIVSSVFYSSNVLFQTPEELLNAAFPNKTKIKRKVISNVLKVSVGNTAVRDLTDPVLLTFTRTDKGERNPSCEFWNFSLRKLIFMILIFVILV